MLSAAFFFSLYFFFMVNYSGSDFVSMNFLVEELSQLMILLSSFLAVVLSIFLMKNSLKLILNFTGTLVVILFFMSDKLIEFFIFFELSLIPLLFFITAWGRQAERLSASFFLLIYTIVCSSPLFMTVSSLSFQGMESFSVLNLIEEGLILSMFSLLAFLVKIPLFFLHSWLPKAHVEAPLEGSVILAGVMLKLGVFGLYRLLQSMSLSVFLAEMIFSISLFGAFISSLISLSSDDMKMSVAYSSVSHMNFTVALLASGKSLAIVGTEIIMISHGLSSPLLFYLVTKIYKKTHTRSVILSKGVLSKFPFLTSLSFFLWAMNISAPPFVPFLGELVGIFSLISFLKEGMILIIFYVICGSFFSMLNFGIYSHSSFKLHTKSNDQDWLFPVLSIVSMMFFILMFLGWIF